MTEAPRIHSKARTMFVTHEEAEQLLRKWWPDPAIRQKTMAERLGVTDRYLCKLCRQFGLPDRRDPKYRERFRVRIRKENHADAYIAAEACGVAENTVRSALSKGRGDFIGLGRSRKHRTAPGGIPKSIRLGPFEWPTQAAAARDLGVSPSCITKNRKAGRHDVLEALAMQYQAKIEKRKAA